MPTADLKGPLLFFPVYRWSGWCSHARSVSNQPLRVSAVLENYLTYPFPFIPHSLVSTSSGRRTRRIVAGSVLSALALLFIRHLSSSLPHTALPDLVLQHEIPPIKPPSTDSLPPWDRKSALLGPPTDFFRGMSCCFDAPLPSMLTLFIRT
jgi:hypothetical protein